MVRTTRFIASPRWTRLRSLRGRLTRCSAAAPRSWRSRRGVPRRVPRVPTQLCTNRNQRRRRRRRGAPRRRRRSPRIPRPPRRRPRMKTGNPASTMKSPRSSQSRARGYRGYRPRYQPSRSSMHRERAWRYRDVHPCRRRGGAGSMKPRMEPTISSWPPRCIRCRRPRSRRCHPRHPRRRRRQHRRTRPRWYDRGPRRRRDRTLCPSSQRRHSVS